MTPWLNIDAGELDDEPDALYVFAHGVSIACGGHAGDARSMADAIDMCIMHGCAAGAHPSYPDREGFGRRAMKIAPEDLQRAVFEQCKSLKNAADPRGVALRHMKPHGALYHAADLDDAAARAIITASIDALGAAISILGPAGGALERVARSHGLAFTREGFADRGARPDGTLIPRGEPGAMIEDASHAAARARELVRAGHVDTICVHGDTKNAVAIARAVRLALDETTEKQGSM